MKIIIPIDAVRYPLTGIGRYTYELATALGQLPEIEELLFLQGTKVVQDLLQPTIPSGAAVRSRIRARLAESRIVSLLYRHLRQQMQGGCLRGKEDYILHGPNYVIPPFAGRSVVTIHDLSLFTLQECHPPERVRSMATVIKRSLERAACIITDSQAIAGEVATFFNWPAEQIAVAPLAPGAEFQPQPPASLQAALTRYGLRAGGYALFVGTIEPRKNINTLLRAYAGLPQVVKKDTPLVLVGHSGWRSEEIHQHIADAQAEGWCRYLSYISGEDLPYLYAGATVFTFPSLYEGFGLPVLEAMASGTPVICSNVSSLPEVAGGAAAMCAPDDVQELRCLIERGLVDASWRQEAIVRGLQQAATFSWRRCAQATAAVYQHLGKQPPL